MPPARTTTPDRSAPRRAFTLVEAMLALSLTAIAGAALLLAAASSLDTTSHALEQTIALGMAEQLMDEVVGAPFAEIDEYDGFRSVPRVDDEWHSSFPVPEGYFDRWRQEIDVYDQSDGTLTVEVRIVDVDPDRGERPLAKLRRVVAYVPDMPEP